MTRNSVNLLIDSAGALVMGGLVVTGSILYFVLPHGSGSRTLLWGWGRHDWGGLHVWLAIAAVVVVLVHLALHWHWVWVSVPRSLGRPGAVRRTALPRNLIGLALIGLLVGALASFIWVADHAAARSTAGVGAGATGATATQRDDKAHHPGDAPLIRGSMTLDEAAAACGIPPDTLRAHLGLPAGHPLDDRMGRIAAEQGLTMHDLRERLPTP